MDIKLKSNKIEYGLMAPKKNYWGMAVMAFIILCAAGGIMAVYPFLETLTLEGRVQITENAMENFSYEGYMATIGETNYLFNNFYKVLEILIYTVLGVNMLVILAAFITALIKPFNMTEKRIFRAPFEVVMVIATCSMPLLLDYGYVGSPLTSMGWYYICGEFQQEFVDNLYLHAFQADVLGWILNFLSWTVMAFLLYWVTTCLTAIITLGPVKYLKERTLTGWICRWLKRLFQKTYNVVGSIDLRDESTKPIMKIVALNFALLAVMSCFWFFGIFGLLVYSVVLFFVLRKNYLKMQESYKVLLKATNELADGNLDVEIKENLGVFEPFRGEIGKIQSGFKKAVDAEVKSQRMKTELITNVSHDLKTPLTAIITYVDLLKKEDITNEERNSYIKVLEQKSLRLKHLIEDLFEVSKANSKNVTLNMVDIDIVNLMKQVSLELEDQIQNSEIDFKWNFPDHKVVLNLDSEKTYRVFENLMVNILKYALSGTRAYVTIEENEYETRVSMKNISAAEISVEGERLSERFVRGDESRNTEGSGLGLAIAKSFTELQKGKIEIETEADLFKVMLVWKKEEMI